MITPPRGVKDQNSAGLVQSLGGAPEACCDPSLQRRGVISLLTSTPRSVPDGDKAGVGPQA